jgi:hypothetical protein
MLEERSRCLSLGDVFAIDARPFDNLNVEEGNVFAANDTAGASYNS